MNVIVLTSDHYLPAVRVHAWFFNKYWSADQEVIVAGFTPPEFDLPANYRFHRIGPFAEFPISKWSDAVLSLLGQLRLDTFVIMLDDYWITRPVDVEAVRMCYDYARQFGYVARIDLTNDRAGTQGDHAPWFYGEIERPSGGDPVTLVQSDPDSQYHASLMAGIWNEMWLRKMLTTGLTPWDVELHVGTPRLAALRDECIVLGTTCYPVKHTLGLRGGDSQALVYQDQFLPAPIPEDEAELRRLGLFDPWEKGT